MKSWIKKYHHQGGRLSRLVVGRPAAHLEWSMTQTTAGHTVSLHCGLVVGPWRVAVTKQCRLPERN